MKHASLDGVNFAFNNQEPVFHIGNFDSKVFKLLLGLTPKLAKPCSVAPNLLLELGEGTRHPLPYLIHSG
jgi:hypothetical protein